jgi:hypothetical protein
MIETEPVFIVVVWETNLKVMEKFQNNYPGFGYTSASGTFSLNI